MPLLALDHVNIRTARLDEMCAFYCDVLGLARGARPPFAFGGAWLYCGDRPVVHLVEAPAGPFAAAPAAELRLGHFAFRATGLADTLTRLRAAGRPTRLAQLPGSDVTQVNLTDPDGNALHIDFAGESALSAAGPDPAP
jgi:catechol 2,3-dioxygenase-like lactoylglutathione lyase family enzyme